MSIFKRVFLLVFLLVLNVAAIAQDPYVPDELKPWAQWVLQDKEYIDCPFFFDRSATGANDFLCAWPGALQLEAGATGGRFSQRWTVTAGKQWIPLPGDLAHWPEDVSIGGRPAAVVARGNTPSIYLEPGRYNISGQFRWSKRPGELAIPFASGLLQLSVDGKAIARPERSAYGVWLGERKREVKQDNTIDVTVYRLVEDGIPTRVSTRLQLRVSGVVREELIGPVVLDGLSPLSIASDLPARLEANGEMRVQVRPGNWAIQLQARATDTLNNLALGSTAVNMPASEIWSYRSDDQLRIALPEGLEPVNPRQVEVPNEWADLPAFRVQAEQALSLQERSRGDTVTDNQLILQRQLWLDYDGSGFTFADEVMGTMRSGWRLDMGPPYALLSASNEGQDLLVTDGENPGQAGVELRSSSLALSAQGRSNTRDSMPASGWQSRFDRMGVQLMLPPGHKLFAAVGADSVPDAWLSRWQLLDFFLLLLVTIAAHRLFGLPVAVLAFVTLVLSLHEPGAPTWSWLNLLAAVALVRVAPIERFARSLQVYRAVSLAGVVILLVPFLIGQITIGLYPQLEQRSMAPRGDMYEQAVYEEGMIRDYDVQVAAEAPQAIRQKLAVLAGNSQTKESFERYAPNTIVQAGLGRPSWSWNNYRLDWSGPVDEQRTLKLLILPRWAVSMLRFTVVFLLLALVAQFLAEVLDRRWPWTGRFAGSGRATTSSVGVMLVSSLALTASLLNPQPARAEVPSPELLQELQKRLLAPPDCSPRCAEVTDASVSITDQDLSMAMTVQALESVAIPLPGSEQGWRPERVSVDGAEEPAVYRDDRGQLWILASKGQRRIRLQGRLPLIDSVELPFPLPPRVIEVQASGWTTAGVSERHLVSGSLQLSRLQPKTSGDTVQVWATNRFPTFVRITRRVVFGLDWEVATTVERVAPAEGAITLDIPLLEGESVMSEQFEVQDGEIKVVLAPGISFSSWRSTLPRTSPLSLAAADKDSPWAETWEFRTSETWHAEFTGLPPSAIGDRSGYYTVFHPRPSEVLEVATSRPDATDGETLAFDNVDVRTDVGTHSRNSTLRLVYRSTRGSQHLLQLPAASEIQYVQIDGRNEPLRADGGALNLPIAPGQHAVEVSWSETQTVGIREVTPAIDLGAAASNINLALTMPSSRWVLATGGPRLGPAVLYWAELAALLLLAAILGRTSTTPLKTRHWLLLGLGFSTFSWSALITVVVWLMALGWRRTWSAKVEPWLFDGVQLLIAVLTFAAMSALVSSMPLGLLGTPDMQITGNGSYGNFLQWFADRSLTTLPQAYALSLPLWLYKALILVWALWLSLALVRWLPWGWQSVNNEGLWRDRPTPSYKRKKVSENSEAK